MSWTRWLAVLLPTLGCFDPVYPRGPCSLNGTCPLGFTCVAEFCEPTRPGAGDPDGGDPDGGDPDASVPDAGEPWQASCVAPLPITRVEDSSPYYDGACIQGGWFLQKKNGSSVPASEPDISVPVQPTAISVGSNPLDPASRFAVHISGSGQANTPTVSSYVRFCAWFNLKEPPFGASGTVGTIDASAYTGIQFHAIVNSPSGALVSVSNLYTEPSGGTCTTTPGPKACWDEPAANLPRSTAWTKYQIPFAALKQGGWGNPSPVGPDFPRNAIARINWYILIPQTGPTPAWDLWIDEVSFY
jgi:hypothetical protein